MAKNLKLEPGKFYRSRVGDIWCCYKVLETGKDLHAQAYCVEVNGGDSLLQSNQPTNHSKRFASR